MFRLVSGAGVSFGAGLPLWADLLSAIADTAKMSTTELRALKSMDFLDAARIIQGRLRDMYHFCIMQR